MAKVPVVPVKPVVPVSVSHPPLFASGPTKPMMNNIGSVKSQAANLGATLEKPPSKSVGDMYQSHYESIAKRLKMTDAEAASFKRNLESNNFSAAADDIMNSEGMKKKTTELGEAGNKMLTGSPKGDIIMDDSLLGSAKKLAEKDGTFKAGDPVDVQTIMKQIIDDVPEAEMHPIAKSYKKMMKEQAEFTAKKFGMDKAGNPTKEAWYKAQKVMDALQKGLKYLMIIGSVVGGFFLIAKLLADQKSGCYMYEAGKTAKSGEQMCRQSDCKPGQNCGGHENKCNGTCCDGAGSSCSKSSRCGCQKFDVLDGAAMMTEGVVQAMSDLGKIATGGLTGFAKMLDFLLKYTPLIGAAVVGLILWYVFIKSKEAFKGGESDDKG